MGFFESLVNAAKGRPDWAVIPSGRNWERKRNIIVPPDADPVKARLMIEQGLAENITTVVTEGSKDGTFYSIRNVGNFEVMGPKGVKRDDLGNPPIGTEIWTEPGCEETDLLNDVAAEMRKHFPWLIPANDAKHPFRAFYHGNEPPVIHGDQVMRFEFMNEHLWRAFEACWNDCGDGFGPEAGYNRSRDTLN